MSSEEILKEIQKTYLTLTGNSYGALIKHREMTHVLGETNGETFQYFEEIQKIKGSGQYRFKIFVDDRTIVLFEPLC